MKYFDQEQQISYRILAVWSWMKKKPFISEHIIMKIHIADRERTENNIIVLAVSLSP